MRRSPGQRSRGTGGGFSNATVKPDLTTEEPSASLCVSASETHRRGLTLSEQHKTSERIKQLPYFHDFPSVCVRNLLWCLSSRRSVWFFLHFTAPMFRAPAALPCPCWSECLSARMSPAGSARESAPPRENCQESGNPGTHSSGPIP